MQILSNCTDAAWEELRDELRDVDDVCCVHKEYASKTKNDTNTMFELQNVSSHRLKRLSVCFTHSIHYVRLRSISYYNI